MLIVEEVHEPDNFHFVTWYPHNRYIEKTVSYITVVDAKSFELIKMGRILVYMRDGNQYTFDCWVNGSGSQYGINVSDDGQYVYVISSQKGLWCYTCKGELVWKTRYTSVSHVFPHPNHNLTCALNTKLVILDSFGKIIQQTPLWKEGAPYKASDAVIAANTSETVVALFDSMTLDVFYRISLKKLGLRRFYQPELNGNMLTINGWRIGDSSEPVTMEIDLKDHPAVIK